MADWRCPRCGRGFTRRNQRHACATQAPEALLAPFPEAARLYPALRDAVLALGDAEVAATKTQVVFRRAGGTTFARLWLPALALQRGSPEPYLAFGLPSRVDSARIKEATEAKPGWFVHHMRLEGLDDEVRDWLRRAHEAAGRP